MHRAPANHPRPSLHVSVRAPQLNISEQNRTPAHARRCLSFASSSRPRFAFFAISSLSVSVEIRRFSSVSVGFFQPRFHLTLGPTSLCPKAHEIAQKHTTSHPNPSFAAPSCLIISRAFLI